MSWIPPASRIARQGIKYGAKYGPQAKILWDTAGQQARSAAKAKLDDRSARRTAFAEAETVVEGSVLRRVWQGTPVWVVYSGDEPVRAYPPLAPLAELVDKADLAKRRTPEEHREAQLRARARRARERAGDRAGEARRRAIGR
ncbi:hypothetical protein GCM10027446_27310 [Angustibacter peucedani]